jgi:CheY-like chemotaxis protein
VPEVDPELLTVLRLLQAAFGGVEVLEVIDGISAANQPQAQGWTFDDGPAPEESPGTSYLEDAGINVVGDAADGAEGVELAAALRPDVVLMDWRMPRLDGVQATSRIRQQLPEVQVVMFTSLVGRGSARPLARLGRARCGQGRVATQICAAALAAAPSEGS